MIVACCASDLGASTEFGGWLMMAQIALIYLDGVNVHLIGQVGFWHIFLKKPSHAKLIYLL